MHFTAVQAVGEEGALHRPGINAAAAQPAQPQNRRDAGEEHLAALQVLQAEPARALEPLPGHHPAAPSLAPQSVLPPHPGPCNGPRGGRPLPGVGRTCGTGGPAGPVSAGSPPLCLFLSPGLGFPPEGELLPRGVLGARLIQYGGRALALLQRLAGLEGRKEVSGRRGGVLGPPQLRLSLCEGGGGVIRLSRPPPPLDLSRALN